MGPGPSEAPLLATSPHTSSEGNPSNKGRPKAPSRAKGWRPGPLAREPPVSKLILSLGSRPDTPSIPTGGVEAENSRYPNLSARKTLRRALALQPSVGRPKQPHPGFGHLSRHPSPQPHAILGEGPSSIVSTHRIQSGIRKCCIFGFSAVFFPRRFTKPSRCE